MYADVRLAVIFFNINNKIHCASTLSPPTPSLPSGQDEESKTNYRMFFGVSTTAPTVPRVLERVGAAVALCWSFGLLGCNYYEAVARFLYFWYASSLVVNISHCPYSWSSKSYSFMYNIKRNLKHSQVTWKDESMSLYLQTCGRGYYAKEVSMASIPSKCPIFFAVTSCFIHLLYFDTKVPNFSLGSKINRFQK